jgi:hypothetical protein
MGGRIMSGEVFPSIRKEKGMVNLEVFNPTGEVDGEMGYAPRLDDLNGKTICEISNRLWQADRTFERIRNLIQARYPDAKILPYTEFPNGSLQIDTVEIGERVKKKGGQAVIVGNAA